MKKIYIPLFWKFTIAIISVVALFGGMNVFLIWKNVYGSLEQELEKRGSYIASSLAAQSVTPILYDDYVNLQKLVDDINKNDTNIVYAFVLNHENLVVAHTFPEFTPVELIKANSLQDGKNMNSVLIAPKNAKEKFIKDIAYPILDGSIGTVRIGIEEEGINSAVLDIIKTLLIMVAVFLSAGIIGALFFSYILTGRIKLISDISEKIDLNSLNSVYQNKINNNKKTFKKWKYSIHTDDELDLLVDKFNGMLERLKNTYEKLRSAQSSLIQSEKLASIGTLAAGIAHEMNNPVSGIRNCIRRISKDPENLHQNRKYLNLIMEASERIEHVIHNLLNYSRQQEMKFEKVNLATVIENSLLLVRHKLENSKISIKKKYDFIPDIEASPIHIEQVIVNLLLNSIDAINESVSNNINKTSEISIEINKPVDSYLQIIVNDTGKGMEKEEIKKIFDPFYTSKSTGKGTGLGLSVSYNIIELHNGTIIAESDYGKGTKFIISLPIRQT
jgi:two-component system NtrC family sensor kinase